MFFVHTLAVTFLSAILAGLILKVQTSNFFNDLCTKSVVSHYSMVCP
jgi:hypothetical protein